MPAMIRIFALAIWAGAIPIHASAAGTVDVTFTVPVQLQNIPDGWSKVGVFCLGYVHQPGDRPPGTSPRPTSRHTLVGGAIDVSGKARLSISQTVTGAIQVPDDSDSWECILRVQLVGATTFTDLLFSKGDGYGLQPQYLRKIKPDYAIFHGSKF